MRQIFGALILLTGLAGCGGPSFQRDLPEPEPPRRVRVPEPGREAVYVVKRGDSLYSIAFGAGKDWRDIASVNGIRAPYVIYPGQVLKLGGPPPVSLPEQDGSAAKAPPPARASLPLPAPGPAQRSPAQPPATASAAKPAPAAAAATPAPARSAPPAASAAAPAVAPPRGAWQWPSPGKLIRRYSGGDRPHKGVDFDGRSGDPVLAANNGTVVYAGNGVRGYGNLLIVKHDATFLSAYAHNSRLLVKEGDVVKTGQKIAEMGDSGTDRVKLHFEIRRRGSPVDPLGVLPRR